MRKISMSAAAAMAAAAGLVGGASGQVQVLFSNIASDPSSVIPGSGGLLFDNGVGTQFDRPHVSPDGTRYILIASFDNGTSEVDNEVIVSGTLSPFTGALRVREGTPTDFDPSANWGTFIRTQASVQNDGSFAFSADTTAATTADEVLAVYNASTGLVTAPVREGQPLPFTLTGFANWGGVNSDANLLSDGSIAGRASTFTGTGGTTKQILYIRNTIVGETDVTVPAGQLVLPAQTLDAWTTTDRFRTSTDGTAWIARGDLNGPSASDDFIMVTGTIVAQEGAPLPGTTGLANVGVLHGDAGSNQISPDGAHWVFRTALADGTGSTASDVVVKNGAVVARTDTPITNETGQTELWDDATFGTTFFFGTVNQIGDIVVGGTTNNSDANANAVLVFNGERVVVREGDPVDLNNNGQNDDNLFIGTFNNDDGFLTIGRVLYFLADLRDGTGTAAGQAFLRIDLNTGGGSGCDSVDFNNDGVFPDDQDLVDFIFVLGGGTCETCNDVDFNNDGVFPDDSDLEVFLFVLGGGTC